MKVLAFFKGVVEFKANVTTSYDDYDLAFSYDMGREVMHKITFRKFDI